MNAGRRAGARALLTSPPMKANYVVVKRKT